jgi:uncharacterized protein (DUF433 family)
MKPMPQVFVNIDPEIQGGVPVFNGTRVPIKILFDFIEEGDSLETFLKQFPSISHDMAIGVLEQARAALANNALPA